MKSKGQLSRLGRFHHNFTGVSDEAWEQTFGSTKPKPLTDEEKGDVRKDYRKQKLRRVKLTPLKK